MYADVRDSLITLNMTHTTVAATLQQPVSPDISPVRLKIRVSCWSNSLFPNFTSATLCTLFRLPDFHLIFRVLNARARSDVAEATFTLTSTPKTRNLGVKLQATGEISGLGQPTDKIFCLIDTSCPCINSLLGKWAQRARAVYFAIGSMYGNNTVRRLTPFNPGLEG